MPAGRLQHCLFSVAYQAGLSTSSSFGDTGERAGPKSRSFTPKSLSFKTRKNNKAGRGNRQPGSVFPFPQWEVCPFPGKP
jgi:hypothetical protein